MISTTRHRFLAERGRVSTIFTLSPILAPRSSCAMNFLRRLTYLRYTGCLTNRSTRTTTVFVILSDETTPTFSALLPIFFESVVDLPSFFAPLLFCPAARERFG